MKSNYGDLNLQRSTSGDFRIDINGLRALAVLLVVFFHFEILNVSGGFVGVDIFFVISGYLMTGIILGLKSSPQNLDFKSILAKFYIARIRRIVPALFVVCVVLMGFGWVALLPNDYKELATEASSALSFWSNVLFWRETGYFDVGSQEKWLLHTWSLSVEWQFYLIYPIFLVLVLAASPNRKRQEGLIACILLLSVAACILLSPTKTKSSFFLLPTRGWEMMAGAWVFLRMPAINFSERRRQWVANISTFVMIACGFLINSKMLWPGYLAIIPVTAASAFILACAKKQWLLGSFAAQWLGTRSYSIYLWHWPVIVGLAYFGVEDLAIAKILGFATALGLGHLSYHFVEKASVAHLGKLQAHRRGYIYLLSGVLGTIGFCIVCITSGGVSGRFSPDIVKIAAESDSRKARQAECFALSGIESPSCMYGGSQLRVVMVGDSHAAATTSAVVAASPDPGLGVLDLSYAMCPTIFGAKPSRPPSMVGHNCPAFIEWMSNKLTQIPNDVPLLIVNRTTRYARGHTEKGENDLNTPSVYFTKNYGQSTPEYMQEFSNNLVSTLCQLSKTRKVFVTQPIPEMGVNVPRTVSRGLILGHKTEVSIALSEYMERHAEIRAAHERAALECGVVVLDPVPYMCKDGRCIGTENGFPLYYDDNHLSEYGNKKLTPMFKEIFRQGTVAGV